MDSVLLRRYDQGGKSAVQSSTSSANSRAVKGGGSKDEESKRHEIVTIALLPAGILSFWLIALSEQSVLRVQIWVDMT